MKRIVTIVAAMAATVSVWGQTSPEQPESTEPRDTVEIVKEEGSELAPDTVRVKPQPRRPSVTPVDIDDNKQSPVLHYYDKHGEQLDEPVLFLATLDTVTKPKAKPNYPLYNGVSVGVNFADGIMQAFGQKYGSYDIWADVSLHNWFFPVVEAGLGFASSTPENKNFTYKVKPSFFMKVGLNYNFLYKSDPSYQLFLGLRAAFSHFGWEATDISINSSYWQETERFNLTGMRSTAWWGEVLAGLKVKVVGNFSLGWTVRWHFPFHVSRSTPGTLANGLSSTGESKPLFIPGYGSSNAFTFSFSAIWTIPAKARKEAIEESETAK